MLPWSRKSYERIHTIYHSSIPKIGMKKFNDGSLPEMEMLIRAEVLRRDLTKRQMNIISMLLTLSYYVGKETAIIPKMQDFEICGISKMKVRKELNQLVELDVVEWDEEKNLFSLRDPREWKVKYNSGYNDDRARELFILNLKDSGVYSEE